MTDSQQLLLEYAADGSERAFRELVERYINMVYSTALRLVGGDTQSAQDVTQTVFISLARKGRTLSSGVMLGGWLHQHTYYTATKAMRNERRRQAREREAVEMSNLQENSDWQHMAPILDEVITQLGSEDRTAILLRFFEQRDFRGVGAALGSNEDAARMRVNRALGKLQSLLKARGVTLSAAALGTVLAAETVSAAPAALAAAACTAALANAAASGTGLTLLKIMASTKLKLSLVALVVTGAATTLIVQRQNEEKLREENQTLRQQLAQMSASNGARFQRLAKASPAPRLPAPAIQKAVTDQTPMEVFPSGTIYAQLTNKPTKLTAAQVEPYLNANHRNAASLLAGFRTTGDQTLLQEAMQKFPGDPQVAFEAALRKDAPDRRQWLDAFKQSAPENALPNYLSAAEHLKAGQMDQAVQDLIAASGKSQFHDYTVDRIQDDEDAYRAGGYSVVEAKAVANMNLLLPQLVQVRELSRGLVDLANSYRQAGDEASRQAVLQMGVQVGQRYGDGNAAQSLVSYLVGISVERMALSAMDPNASYSADGQSVQDRINQLVQARSAVKELTSGLDSIWPAMSEQDWISYHSRSMAFGEQNAIRWVVAKYGQR